MYTCARAHTHTNTKALTRKKAISDLYITLTLLCILPKHINPHILTLLSNGRHYEKIKVISLLSRGKMTWECLFMKVCGHQTTMVSTRHHGVREIVSIIAIQVKIPRPPTTAPTAM